MADKIHLTVVSPASTVIDTMVSYIRIPTDFGSVGILNGHAPMVCSMEAGIVRVKYGDDQTASIRVSKGIADISDNEATLLVSEAEIV